MREEYKPLMETAEDCGAAVRRLDAIVAVLRRECPWDRVQTHTSLRRCMIEEAYEAADAIDRDDTANLREELGDVLLQVVFHASLADAEGRFRLADVINEECEKMIRRHPHVFSEESDKTVDKVLQRWENIKESEHDEHDVMARLNHVPRAFPALLRCRKLIEKAVEDTSKAPTPEQACRKVKFNLKKIEDAVDGSEEEMGMLTGDLLFSIVELTEILGTEPEEELAKAADRFLENIQRSRRQR